MDKETGGFYVHIWLEVRSPDN